MSKGYLGVDFKQEFGRTGIWKKRVVQENAGITSLEHSKILQPSPVPSLEYVTQQVSIHFYGPSFNYHSMYSKNSFKNTSRKIENKYFLRRKELVTFPVLCPVE